MFRSEVNGHHENQEICLKIFPPQVTAGESAVAQLEPVGAYLPRDRQRESAWSLACEDAQLGMSSSYSTGIPVRFDQPGRKRLLATSRLGANQNVLARTDLIVHGQVEGEIDFIVENLEEFGACRWFQSILDRHPGDLAYRDNLDLILCRHLIGPVDSVRKTAFSLLIQMHRSALKKAAAKFFRRDDHAIEDAVQEASRRAWRSLRLIDSGRRFGPWIHKALLNACRDLKKDVCVTTRGVNSESFYHDEAIATVDARDVFEQLTRGCNRDDVAIFTLRYAQEKGLLDIARALKIQPDRPDQTRVSTVRRQVERLKRDVKAAHDFHGDTQETGGIA